MGGRHGVHLVDYGERRRLPVLFRLFILGNPALLHEGRAVTTRRSLISGAAALAAYQALGARAQGIPGMAIPPGLIAGASPFAIQYRAAYTGTNSVSSQTVSSVDFGAADAARSILIVGGYWCSASQK